MTDDSGHPAGLVTDTEVESLADSEAADNEAVRARLRERLSATLRDMSRLYQFLPDEDIETVFNPGEDRAQSQVRVGTQDGLALLVLGILANDDMLEMRLRNAIQNAGISHGEDIDVSLELRRGPRPSIEKAIARVGEEGYSERMVALFEYYLWDPATEPDQVIAFVEELPGAVSDAEKQEIRSETLPFARPPQSIITGVSVAESAPTDETDQ